MDDGEGIDGGVEKGRLGGKGIDGEVGRVEGDRG